MISVSYTIFIYSRGQQALIAVTLHDTPSHRGTASPLVWLPLPHARSVVGRIIRMALTLTKSHQWPIYLLLEGGANCFLWHEYRKKEKSTSYSYFDLIYYVQVHRTVKIIFPRCDGCRGLDSCGGRYIPRSIIYLIRYSTYHLWSNFTIKPFFCQRIARNWFLMFTISEEFD